MKINNTINYKVEVQNESAQLVNLISPPLSDKVEIYKISTSVTQSDLRKRMMAGEIVMFINHRTNADSFYMIVLTQALTKRIPSMEMPTDGLATSIVNKHNDLINEALAQLSITELDRKNFDHMTIGIPNPAPSL